MDSSHQVHYYRATDRSVPFDEWFQALEDPIARYRVQARLKLLEFGQLGDWKWMGAGVYELRIHTGPGYRVYIGKSGLKTFIVLWAGLKRTQARDIARAQHYWADFLRRTP
jgi:putative addiction module killer protein